MNKSEILSYPSQTGIWSKLSSDKRADRREVCGISEASLIFISGPPIPLTNVDTLKCGSLIFEVRFINFSMCQNHLRGWLKHTAGSCSQNFQFRVRPWILCLTRSSVILMLLVWGQSFAKTHSKLRGGILC